ncbi:MAG: cytochrome b/b6 domain-containing protein [Gammaproteobacteria bacterium]|jgi:cytochrome b561
MITPSVKWYDQPDSFGWISIALHWLTAAVIIALWFLGKSIEFQAADQLAERRSLHVTLGLVAWLLLAARIFWRLRHAHPRARGQGKRIHQVARFTHYWMLALLSIMLLSGPLLAWTLSNLPDLAGLLHRLHALSANLLALLIVIHIAGALKHLMFNDDETVARIFIPRRQITDAQHAIETSDQQETAD